MLLRLAPLVTADDAAGTATNAGTGAMVSTAAAATVRGRHVALHRRVQRSIHRQDALEVHSLMSNQDHDCGAISSRISMGTAEFFTLFEQQLNPFSARKVSSLQTLGFVSLIQNANEPSIFYNFK